VNLSVATILDDLICKLRSWLPSIEE